MAKKIKTKGPSKTVDEHDDAIPLTPAVPDQSMGEFINELHGDNTLSQPVDGMPSVEWLQEQFKTKSAVIRYLTSQKFEVKQIARHLGMRYQHVRNVAKSTLKRGPNEDWRKPYLEGTNVPNVNDFKTQKD